MRKYFVEGLDKILLLCIGLLIFISCQKTVHGFLSDRVFYLVNPFSVPQGQTAVSASLVTDGSTAPLFVKLLSFKDSSGTDVAAQFTTPQPIKVYAGDISYLDSTVEELQSKIKDSTVTPFNIDSIGGRLQFTAATAFVNPGIYNMDISVSNVRGTKVLKNACQVNITPQVAYILPNAPYSYFSDTATGNRNYDKPAPIITVIHNASGPAVITFKWIDVNGKIFNPAKYEIVPRNGLSSFQTWDPYFAVELTDTAMVFKYPDHLPVFPPFNTTIFGGAPFANYDCYYKIPADYIQEPGQEVRSYYNIYFPNAVGSYNITIQVLAAHKKE